MVLSKGKLIFWLLTVATIGLTCGYLSSSKFCSVSIGRRVEKISTLNQKLRTLFALRTLYNFEYAQATALKTPNQETIRSHLLKTNEEISNLIGAYYDKQAGININQFLDGQTKPEEFAVLLAQLNPTWAQSIDNLKDNFVSSQDNLSKIQEALANKNWDHALNLFEKDFGLAMEFSDELDRGITQQFPHKF